MITLLIFILILGILVLIHEFGHFIVAKKNGVYVEEFGFGFPPRLFGIKIGETMYSINLIPLGGFVKVYGEEYHEDAAKISDSLKNRAFIYKKPWQKSLIIAAGVMMNFILAVVIYYLLLASNNYRSEPFTLFNDYNFRFGSASEKRVVVANLVANSPARKAGVDIGDIVLQIQVSDQIKNDAWINVYTADELIKLINSAEGKNVFINFINVKNNQRKTASIVPRYNTSLKRAVIGVGLAQTISLSYNEPQQKLFAGFMHSYNVTAYSVYAIRLFATSAFKEKSFEPVSETVSGPIGIFKLVDEIVKSSGQKLLINLANLMALLSLSLAMINIFPFPALDGGRLIFVLYEWVSRKRPNATVERYVNLIGFVTLIALAIVISVNDILKLGR